MEVNYHPFFDDDPRALDQRTPPPSPPPRQGGSLISPEWLKTPEWRKATWLGWNSAGGEATWTPSGR